ncbi:MAG TPA: hypothetical protein VK447_05570, partial [Myxococcaceae bacterium]|nr:hypothetical protein [Myxococcaceae bacterium]
MPMQSKRAADRVLDDKHFLETEAALERAGRVEELIRLYESHSRDVPPADAAPLLTKAADLARERLKNLPRAEELLRRALLAVPDAKEPLFGLKSVYEGKPDPASLVEVLERLAPKLGGPQGA